MAGSAGSHGRPSWASDTWAAESGFAGLAAENRRLRAERAQRHLTDLATGVLAAQLGLSTADAAEHLTALAAATGLSPQDLAADVVNALTGAEGRGGTGGTGGVAAPSAPGGEADAVGPAGTGGAGGPGRPGSPEALGGPRGEAAPASPEDSGTPGGPGGPRTPAYPEAPGGLTAPSAPGGEAAPAPPAAPPPPHLARRLRRTVAAVETADDVGGAAEALLDGGLGPLGADSVWLWRLVDGGCLRLAGHAGVGAAEAAAWWWIPPAAPEAIRAVLDGDAPVWLPEGPADPADLPGAGVDAARAVLPLRRRGTTEGVALVGWPGPVAFDPALRRAVDGLMDVAVALLDRPDADETGAPVLVDLLDALTHPAALLRTDAATGAPVLEHVNEAAVTALGGTLPADDPSLARAFPHVHPELARLARRARHTRRPGHAARLPAAGPPVDPADGPGPLLDVRVLPAGPDRAVVLWHTAGAPGLATGRAVARLQSVATFQDSLTGGDTVWSEQAYGIFGMSREEAPLPLLALRARVHEEDGEALTALLRTLTDRRTGAQTVLRTVLPDGSVRHVRVAAEPLLDGDTVTGFVGAYQDVSATRRTELALTATFDRLTAVRDQAELRHQVALQLQQAIVPEATALRELPGGLTVAARYRPAAEEYQVGGDWYDVLPLPGGKVLLAVGDIAGHGIDSVTGMVSLRNAQRALAFTGRPPHQLMGWLNEVTLRTGDGSTATAVCALYDPEDGGLVWSSAGHLPLLLIRDGRARLLEPPQDILLGAVPSYAYEERRTALRPGDTLLLYTDGLVERRHEGLGPGLARLLAVATRLSVPGRESPELLVDALLGMALGDTDDDTSVVAVRVRRPEETAGRDLVSPPAGGGS
ncbi:SpoIIE family protein phosphatase [Streptomyces sp. NPDC048623]|uniref:SpoIIE family protein phosphatase n=1 Tax=Streptomyces sp. NPDC048623 TaxID=3155761 RepID=UPI003425C158